MPINPITSDRTLGDWTFMYQGYKRNFVDGEMHVNHLLHGFPKFRSGATRENMFPDCRKGSLCPDVLSRLGCSPTVMKDHEGNPDALFFFQNIFPIGDTTLNDNDPRLSFYPEMAKFTNGYAVEIGLCSGYGHKFNLVDIPELVHHHGVLIQDGVLGGSDGAILRRFKKTKYNTAYCPLISKSMTSTRFLQIKRCMKLNNNAATPKKGQEGYNPAAKYDLPYKVLVHNVNAITKSCGLDMCADETTWGHQGFGEAGSGVLGQILGKPGITKGGQTVICSDVDRIRPRAYVHRHKCHDYQFPQKGPSEIYMIIEDLKLLKVPYYFG